MDRSGSSRWNHLPKHQTDNKADGTQTGQESTTTKANAAKTGDFAPIAGVIALVLAGVAVVTLKKKK